MFCFKIENNFCTKSSPKEYPAPSSYSLCQCILRIILAHKSHCCWMLYAWNFFNLYQNQCRTHAISKLVSIAFSRPISVPDFCGFTRCSRNYVDLLGSFLLILGWIGLKRLFSVQFLVWIICRRNLE
jgi:hypothetical protein